MNIPIPDGLTELLTDFAGAALRSQPADLLHFSLEYFTQKIEDRRRGGGGGGGGASIFTSWRPGGAAAGGALNLLQRCDSEEDGGDDFVAPVMKRFTRRASVCAEAYDPDEDDDRDLRVIHSKTDDQRYRLQEACNHILLFKNLERDQMSQVLDAMFEKPVRAGDHVIDLDDDGDNFYVIESGTFDIWMRGEDGAKRAVGRYDNKGSFGELALMYNTPRAATIIATSRGALWCLDRDTFRRIILNNNAKKRRMYEAFIESLPLLKSLESSERMRVVDVLVSKSFRDEEQIIAQGDKADCFCIVESGQVRIAINRSKMNELKDEVQISVCKRGDYFGELALVTNKPRAASAYAQGHTRCLVMDVQAFERLLGPCMDIMKRNITHYEEQLVQLFSSTDL
ncbi:cAMP-dependent protein kinase type II-beta regulatory subunit-like [Polymixia lowei]